jgi:tetratricopeptide (TPR) repeat protein
MSRLLIWLAVGVIALAVSYAWFRHWGPHGENCEGLWDQATAAGNAQDWPTQDRLATAAVSACEKTLPPKELAVVLLALATANNKMKRGEKAFAVSERCIRTYYHTPACHVELALALRLLGRQDEALEATKRAKRLAQACLENEERELRSPSVDRELHEMKQRDCRSTLDYSDSLLKAD